MAELLAWAEGEPGRTDRLRFGRHRLASRICGASTSRRGTGLPLEHVGYKGSAEALRDVMAGHVPLFADVLMPTAAAGESGQAAWPCRGDGRALARCCPTCRRWARRACPGMEGAVPFGISATGGTPVALVEGLNAAFNEALGDAGVRRKLQELGFIPIGGTAAFYAQSLAEETAKWRKVIKESKIPAPA